MLCRAVLCHAVPHAILSCLQQCSPIVIHGVWHTVDLQAGEGGSIDPSVFTDTDGKQWLLFKNDGNAVGQPTYIYLCPLTQDALQVPSHNLKQPDATHAVALLEYFNFTSLCFQARTSDESHLAPHPRL